jgi:hypothetical protein
LDLVVFKHFHGSGVGFYRYVSHRRIEPFGKIGGNFIKALLQPRRILVRYRRKRQRQGLRRDGKG